MIIFMTLYEVFGEWLFRMIFCSGIIVWLYFDIRFPTIFSLYERVLLTHALSFLWFYFEFLEYVESVSKGVLYGGIILALVVIPFFLSFVALIIRKFLFFIKSIYL